MRIYQKFVIVILFLVACNNQKEVKSIVQIRKELQGLWLLNDTVADTEMNYFTLYFNHSICHVSDDQSNLNRYKIHNSILELKIRTSSPVLGNRVRFKIVRIDNQRLDLYPMSRNLKEYFQHFGIDTLKFHKLERQNDFHYNTITFGSSGCFGNCPSFSIQMNSSGEVLYEGFSFVKSKGKYEGKSDSEFYKILKDKLKYVDFKNLKTEYQANWTDDQTVGFIVETNNKLYRTRVYGEDKEPAALRNVFSYIFSNSESVHLIRQNKNLHFKHEKLFSEMGFPEVIEFLPPLINN